ncbi:uncharacterized protein LOC128960251 [Oppia nitens]|uniref:uncharacterized protein LOC128960251 n=1 Tax=Oppia nitens TaxID=1686743 RepID=UPI0023DA5F36|nr:uncharacterized protein LOC128960251 [Oppia nitens]
MANTYTAPNFLNVFESVSSLNQTYNLFDYTALPDYNGAGLLSANSAAKHNKLADFYARHPSLPFYVDKHRQLYGDREVNTDCLVKCELNSNQKMLLWSVRDEINGLSLVTDSDDRHVLAADESTDCKPFRQWTDRWSTLYRFKYLSKQPIIDLNVNESGDKIQSLSRTRVCIFKFNDRSSGCDDSNETNLYLKKISSLKSRNLNQNCLFSYCHRNDMLDNQLLLSYKNWNVIHCYDIEVGKVIDTYDDQTFGGRQPISSGDQQTGLQWDSSNNHQFFYGEDNRLLYCDSRLPGSPVVTVFNNIGDYKTFHVWELMTKFSQSQLNPNQQFVATDCHLFVVDWRNPKRSLLQMRHMKKSMINNIKSVIIEKGDHKRELLIASNSYNNLLFSFESVKEMTNPSSLHLPLLVSDPQDISFPDFRKYFLRGVELVDSPDKSGFSVSLLTQFGDIFMQDFDWDFSEPVVDSNGDSHYRDRSMRSSPGLLSTPFDPQTNDYLEVIKKLLINLKFDKNIDFENFKICPNEGQRVCELFQSECQCRDTTVTVGNTNRKKPERVVSATTSGATLGERSDQIAKLEINSILNDKSRLESKTDKYSKRILNQWFNLNNNSDNDVYVYALNGQKINISNI